METHKKKAVYRSVNKNVVTRGSWEPNPELASEAVFQVTLLDLSIMNHEHQWYFHYQRNTSEVTFLKEDTYIQVTKMSI